ALNRNDAHHEWAVALLKQVRPPLLVCEAVLTEAAYFLREDDVGADPLFALIDRGALDVRFDVAEHWPRLRTLMKRYSQMDLADACVVAMCEQSPKARVLTLDRKDFSVYRRNDRQVIDFVAPPQR
ncbi:MAG: PIN domain-containing protein, partial [Myxococcaceae bacterium]|nr:PIN domain-containing protein [Myxococcaceae bacterium]